ncbi:MAG TPA: FAD-dependent oxidoreductase, partial [Minicystis sp.]|nr:FAD-dependent oxidoreductase [Minicystis sp.]
MARTSDFLVIGSGIAGLTFALDAAEHGTVLLVTKRERDEANTKYAQGGIAAVMGEGDTPEQHAEDTMAAGAGLCHDSVVDLCAREGPDRVRELVARGAQFDVDDGKLALTREAAHSARRVVHAADATGAEVERALVAAANAHPNIEILEHHMAIDLIMLSRFGGPEMCAGAYVLDELAATSSATGDGHVVETCLARATVLATGGAGKVYLYTTNPDVATGDGVAMAYRAGAEIGNMEFYQFHPTALYHPTARRFLISEAVRGEGGVLRLQDGTAFMAQHD